MPAATSFFAANSASRASAKLIGGNFPKVSVPRRPPRPPNPKSHRKAMVQAGLPCAYSPSRSGIFLVSEGGFLCQANDKLTYLNERQIDLPVDVRFFGSQRGVQRADGRELSWLCPLSYFFVVTAPSFGCCSAHSIGVSCKTDSFCACSMR